MKQNKDYAFLSRITLREKNTTANFSFNSTVYLPYSKNVTHSLAHLDNKG